MTYKISAGIEENELKAWISEAYKKYGLYKGKYVNYTNADIAPVIMCTIIVGEEILLCKRAYGLADANGYWSTVNGFIDEIKSVNEFVIQEVREELGFSIDEGSIRVGKSFTLKNDKEKRSYIVFSCLVILKSKPLIKLDREHTEYTWIERNELGYYYILEDLPFIIDSALKLST